MESEISLETLEQQYILKIKIAVAFVILRNKPKAIPTIQYVDDLMSTYQRQVLDSSDNSPSIDRDHLINCQQKLINELELTNLIFQDADSNNILTPPLSGKCITSNSISLDRMLTKHTTFLQSSFKLRSVSNLIKEQLQIDKVIEQTVIDSIQIVYNFLSTDIHKITSPCVSSTIKATMKICDLVPQNSNLQKILKTFTADFQNTVIKKVLFNDNVTQITKNELVKLLCQFMHCYETRDLLLNTLYNYAVKFFKYIKRISMQIQKLHDPSFFENNYYILSCLTECITESIDNHDLMPPQNYIIDLTTAIENCFPIIEDTFPLISHALWQMMIVINNVSQNRNVTNSNFI